MQFLYKKISLQIPSQMTVKKSTNIRFCYWRYILVFNRSVITRYRRFDHNQVDTNVKKCHSQKKEPQKIIEHQITKE